MDFNPPGSSVNGIFQARVLEWVAISFSGGSYASSVTTTKGPINYVSVLLSKAAGLATEV